METADGACIENVMNHTITLALVQASFGRTRNHAARILASMLEKAEIFTDLHSCILALIGQQQAHNTTCISFSYRVAHT